MRTFKWCITRTCRNPTHIIYHDRCSVSSKVIIYDTYFFKRYTTHIMMIAEVATKKDYFSQNQEEILVYLLC